jgi:hypothetical protein
MGTAVQPWALQPPGRESKYLMVALVVTVLFGSGIVVTLATTSNWVPPVKGPSGGLSLDTGATLALNPNSGIVGSTTTATGTGFLLLTEINFTLDGVSAASSCASSLTGTFSCAVTIPAVPNGDQTMVASDGTNTPSATFTIDALFSLNPTNGIVGSTTTATGTGFDASSTMTFTLDGTVAASSCSSNSTGGFSCAVTIPAAPEGTRTMAASDGVNDAPATFTVNSFLGLEPISGSVGSTTSASGTGFESTQAISFTLDGVSATSSCSSNSTGGFSCLVTIPAVPNGEQTMLASDGTNSPSAAFVVGASLTLAPSGGVVGSPTVATGSGFAASETIAFTLGSVPASSSCASASSGSFSCAVVIPAVPNGGETMLASDGTNSASAVFTVTTPAIDVFPQQGPVGASVTVSGTGFSESTALTSLFFDGVSVTSCSTGSLVSSGSGSLSCSFAVPGGTSGTTVTATNVGGLTATGAFTVTPVIITVDPQQGPVGSTVTVSGTGFSVTTAGTTLSFDGQTVATCAAGSLTTSASGTFSCSFEVPSGESGNTVVATDVGGQSARRSFSVTTLQVNVIPLQGPVGATVLILGSGFSVSTTLTSLTFDGKSVAVCDNGSLITSPAGTFSCSTLVPSGTSGSDVIATDVGGQFAAQPFTITSPAIAVMPQQGPVGTPVTVLGTGFSVSAPLTSLTLDAQTVTTCTTGSLTTSISGTFSCTFAVPSGASGSTVTAKDPGGESGNGVFTLTIPVLGLSVKSGAVGSMVVASGSGYVPQAGFSVSWNRSTILCSGLTNATGAFGCAYTVPSAPAGPHEITGLQSVASSEAAISVIPTFSLSAVNGTVGSSVTVLGSGFENSTSYHVAWNTSWTLCSGTTNTNGGFNCTFVVPPSLIGTATITTIQGIYAPTFSFTVSPSPPAPPEATAAFPWWIVAVVGFIIAILLMGVLIFEQRRHHGGRSRSHRAPSPWTSPPEDVSALTLGNTAVSGTAGSLGLTSGFDPSGSHSSPAGAAAVSAGSAGERPSAEPEDIDVLIGRLERMSMQMFNKHPKQLANEPAAGESLDPADLK